MGKGVRENTLSLFFFKDRLIYLKNNDMKTKLFFFTSLLLLSIATATAQTKEKGSLSK